MKSNGTIRRKILSAGLFAVRFFSYFFVITTFGILFILAFSRGNNLFVFGNQSGLQNIIYTFFALLIAVSFAPLKNLIDRKIEKIFLKYDSKKLQEILTKIIIQNLDLRELTSKLLHELLITMRITKGCFIILDERFSYPVITENFDHVIGLNRQVLDELSKSKRLLNLNEEGDLRIKNILRGLEISIFLPLYIGDKLQGFLLLGEKISGNVYTDEDLALLKIFGPKVSVAIYNTKNYDQVKKSNITLELEVESATRDLKVANNKLKDLDRLKDDFVSIASHELRTPMTAIRSYAWMALYRSDVNLSERLKRYLHRTLISTERLINLVNDMLNISRIESGKIEILPKAFNIVGLVDEVLMEVSEKAKEKSLSIMVHKTPVPQVFADPDKVHQVLLNLVGNALKFTPIEGNITLSFFFDGQMVEVLVKDNGVGIAKDDLQRLFKKFGRLDDSYVAAATSGGTGLGLYISKSLINLMGGIITGSSPGEGKGATFKFSLPVATTKIISEPARFTHKLDQGAKLLEPVAI